MNMRHHVIRWAAASGLALTLTLTACATGNEGETAGRTTSAANVDGGGETSESGSEGTATTAEGDFQLAEWIQKDIDDEKELSIRLSYHDPSLPFANPLREGVAEAAQEYGVDAQLIGPAGGDPQQQVSELQTLIQQQRVHALAVSSSSNDALAPVINMAVEAGIPTISFNTSNPDSKQMAFVGQDLVESGRIEGVELLQQLDGTAGKVVVFSVDSGAGWSNDRFSGFEEALEGSDLEVVGPVNTGNEPSQAYNQVQNTMTANDEAVAIASMDCCSLTAASRWVEENDRQDIVVAGFDALPTTLDAIRDGWISSAISQNPRAQATESIRILHDFLVDGKPLSDVTTETLLVTLDNVDDVPPEG